MREAQQTASTLYRNKPCLFYEQLYAPLRFIVVFFFVLVIGEGLNAQSLPGDEEAGEEAVAERYAAWAEAAIARGRWPEAEAALERAADFADVSSDLSYLLALVRFHESRPQWEILEALKRAIEGNRWNRYSPEKARLLEAEVFIRLRFYGEALGSLSLVPESADAALLRLLALRGLQDIPLFQRYMSEALARYPRDPRHVRILLDHAAETFPGGAGRALIDTVLRRLSPLLESDQDLAWLAVPFIKDAGEAARLVSSYRAMGGGSRRAIPAALMLGIIDDEDAIRELFSSSPEEPILDRALILSVWELLRNSEGRVGFQRNLLGFSGVITEDRDRDGWPESRIQYHDGMIQNYAYDGDQDGILELEVFFGAGLPLRGEILVFPEAGIPGEAPAFSEAERARAKALVFWERYPALLRVELGGVRYIPRPSEFLFSPLKFTEIGGSGPDGFLYPREDFGNLRLSRRSLISFAVTVEGPSAEIRGAVERVELDRGIIQRTSSWLENRLVSVTGYAQGRKVIRKSDLDLDGRLETIIRFSPEGFPASSESDWDGDGIYETGEEYFSDGKVARSWDMDKDGLREYTELFSEELFSEE
jgi:tetratricopeptide (TPR) repeat protein